MKATKTDMPETMYRASRTCRALGNPSAYLILRCLGSERKSPTTIAGETLLTLPAVSMTLRHLRDLDLVRYETTGRNKLYWVKSEQVLVILDTLESLVEGQRTKT